jgi:MFS family permease
LWLAWLAANMTMWMNDVAAAWLMTSLTTSPVMVALVQTASTLPVFLLGIPSGALADIVDRRRYFASTQAWVSVNALVVATLSVLGLLTAPLLLALTFVNGIGLAMRWPVFAAIVPSVVTRAELPAALGLGGISMNLSRIVAPMLAGALITLVSPAAVFVLNAVLAGVGMALILRWRSTPSTSPLPGERFVGALRVGIAFAMQSPRLQVVLARVFLFFVQAMGMLALLPLVARQMHGGGPWTFTVMMSCLGAGAIAISFYLPRLRARWDHDRLVRDASLIHAAATAVVVLVPELWVAIPGMLVVGAAWITVAQVLLLAAQTGLPDWVRARGMSIYQTALMGGSAFGSVLWGQVADLTSVTTAVLLASAFGLVVVAFGRRISLEGRAEIDFSPASTRSYPEPAFPIEADSGPVMVTIEYRIDPANAEAFAAVMRQTRRSRLRQGALSWGLFRDSTDAAHYVEYFVDENWVEHQRRLERFSAGDLDLRQKRLALHVGSEPPILKRYIGDALDVHGAPAAPPA